MKLMLRIKQGFSAFRGIFQNPDKATYYPERPRKSKIRIWLDQLMWIMRYGEVNHFYYLWGCDCKNTPSTHRYFSKKKFCRRRDWINANAVIGGIAYNYNCLLQDKFVFSQYVNALGFPVPACLALCSRTHIQWLGPYRSVPLSDLSGQKNMECFVKDVLGERAERVYKLQVKDGDLLLNGQSVSFEQFQKQIGEKNILQEAVRQHSLLEQINPCSVNTIRIVTARKGSAIVPLAAMLRLGTKKGVCDNLAAGGLAAGIDLSSGTLSEWAFFKPGHGKRTQSHPDTGFVFKDVKIPYFDETVRMVTDLHRFFYGCHSIGWDIVITPDGPVILEGNNSWEIPTLQIFEKMLVSKYNDTLTTI